MPMVKDVISLKQSLTEYERVKAINKGVTDMLMATLDSIRQYVIETEPSMIEQFRRWADSTIGKVDACLKEPEDQAFDEARSSIRGGLRDYRDRAGRYINELRTQLTATTEALHQTLATLQSGDSDAETQLKDEITRLESLQRAPVNDMRNGLRTSIVSLSGCVAQLRQEKDAFIAQLRDEIHTLQNSLQEARRAASIDITTGVQNRQQFEHLITQAIRSRSNTSVVRLTLVNLNHLTNWYHRRIIDQLLSAVCKRAQGALPEDAVLGRWRENMFCALVASDDPRAIVSALARKCAGNYICMDGVHARTLYLQVAVASFPAEGAEVDTLTHTLDSVKT